MAVVWRGHSCRAGVTNSLSLSYHSSQIKMHLARRIHALQYLFSLGTLWLGKNDKFLVYKRCSDAVIALTDENDELAKLMSSAKTRVGASSMQRLRT